VREGEAVRTTTGLEIHFKGTSRDEFEDGTFDVLAHLSFRLGAASKSWLPSLLARSGFVPILGHCVRLPGAKATRGPLLLEVYGAPGEPR